MSQLIVIPSLPEALPLITSAGFTQTEDPIVYQKEDSGWKLLIAGIGTVPVIYNLTKHFATNRYEKVIHCGIAGSYFLPLQPGEVVQVIRDTFVDVGIDHGGIFRWIFHENLWNPDEKPFRNGWMEVQEDRSLKLETVNGITVDLVTAGPERKARLADKFNPQIESMEGAAVFYVCKMEDIPVIQIRAISNYVGVRDRHSWKTEEAIAELTKVISELLCK
ncbi:MAG: futalosine hydrolase [Porphyromonadaceae bacterium]|nr:MAG: futalosine hydrolase [Porphyromonadaceae bacterium]